MISDNSLLQTLRDEKTIRMPGGLYHELQVRMTYNSNHIEGSRLSEGQTRLIFRLINYRRGIAAFKKVCKWRRQHFYAV